MLLAFAACRRRHSLYQEMADKIMEEYVKIANVRHVTFDDSRSSGAGSPSAVLLSSSPSAATSVPAGSPSRVSSVEKGLPVGGAAAGVDPTDVVVDALTAQTL